MDPREMERRETVNLLGFALLLFSGAFLLFSLAMSLLPLCLEGVSERAAQTLYQLVYGALYALIFLLPVFFFCKMRSRTAAPAPMYLQPHLQGGMLLYLFAGLAAIHLAAQINARVVELMGIATPVTVGPLVEENYGVALQFMVLAVIPAFVEELLFRGVVLSNLLPYGKTVAIWGSGVLFGVMHQNFSQLLYATVAGGALGYIYVASRSIWPCILLHLCNNGLSVVCGALSARLPAETAMPVCAVIELLILAAGFTCAIPLLLNAVKRRRALAVSEPTAQERPRHGFLRGVAALCAPTMIAFVVISLAQAVVNVLLNALL